jgi:lysine biosynthesis protein LysW
MAHAECPSCGEKVKVADNAKIGNMVTCNGCGDILEVVWLDPVELDWPVDDDDDDDDYDDDDEQ